MTEKVKLPREVADAIEKLRNSDYTDYGIVANVAGKISFATEASNIAGKVIWDWTFGGNAGNADRLLDALRIGYEVEPEYKENDWVQDHHGKFGRKVGQFKHGDIGQTVEGVVITSKSQVEQAYTYGNLRGFFPIESYILFEDGDANA